MLYKLKLTEMACAFLDGAINNTRNRGAICPVDKASLLMGAFGHQM